MRRRTLRRSTWIDLPRDTVFPFFADARNLDRITPPWLGFRILEEGDLRLQRGARIDYRIRLKRVPIRWRTEIRDWDPPHRFVDVQLRGPYRLWEHEHTFEEEDGGTWVHDRVDYVVPGGALEPWIHDRLVRPDLERIFDYREDRILEILRPRG